jgi:hypothetical protein
MSPAYAGTKDIFLKSEFNAWQFILLRIGA